MPGRRRTLIGLGTIVLGASGFVASGAFELGSDGSSGTDWVQVASADQAVPTDDETDGPAGASDTGDGGDGGQSSTGIGADGADGGDGNDGGDGGDGSDSDGDDGDDSNDESDEDDGDDQIDGDDDNNGVPETTRVQVVTDPDDDGNYVGKGDLQWNGQMAGSETVEGTEDGLFERFTVANANKNAVSRVGLVDENGYPRGRIAFLVVNVGDPATPGRGGDPVEVAIDLLDDDGNALVATDQLNFPYRVLNQGGQVVTGKRGTDLLGETVTLPTGGIIEVVIEVDSTAGTDVIERVETLAFTAQEAGN